MNRASMGRAVNSYFSQVLLSCVPRLKVPELIVPISGFRIEVLCVQPREECSMWPRPQAEKSGPIPFHAFPTAPGVLCDTEIPSCSPTTGAGCGTLKESQKVAGGDKWQRMSRRQIGDMLTPAQAKHSTNWPSEQSDCFPHRLPASLGSAVTSLINIFCSVHY